MYRTHTCGELQDQLISTNRSPWQAGYKPSENSAASLLLICATVMALPSLLFGEELNEQLNKHPLGREFVMQAKGTVSERSNKNPNIPTGDIEIAVTIFTILNKSATPPFTIQDDTDGGDDLRMKYRYLDLRRNAVKKNLECVMP